MKIINQILLFLLGSVFTLSGLIKLNDPVGTEIKLEEYFDVFKADKLELGLSAYGVIWDFFIPYSLTLALILAVAEVVLGLNLVLFHRVRGNLWTILVLITFFTFLTFYSAVYNKVTDCGCFGDAIKLSPWQSFYKDVILLNITVLLLTVSFWRPQYFLTEASIRLKAILSTVASLAAFGLGVYTLNYLSIIDFRAYKVGASIPDQMKPSAELKYGPEVYVYLNKKTGKDEQFTAEVFMQEWKKLSDTTLFKFKKHQKPLLNPEALPKITDYKVTDAQGKDITQETFKGKKLLIIVPQVSKTHSASYEKINRLIKLAEKANIQPMIFTATDRTTFEAFSKQFKLTTIPFFFVDDTVLKTMIRSNPGIMLLDEGRVKGKWHYNSLPDSGVLAGIG